MEPCGETDHVRRLPWIPGARRRRAKKQTPPPQPLSPSGRHPNLTGGAGTPIHSRDRNVGDHLPPPTVETRPLQLYERHVMRTPHSHARWPQTVSATIEAFSQYTSIRFTERLGEAGIQPSVGAVGSSYDTRSPKRSTVCTRPRRSTPANPGGPSRKSSWPPHAGPTTSESSSTG
jgi:hypothetical protein